MQKIDVITISTEEIEHGVVELWTGGRQVAFTFLDEGELKLWLRPLQDGGPFVVGLKDLTDALSEVHHSLASKSMRGTHPRYAPNQPRIGRCRPASEKGTS